MKDPYKLSEEEKTKQIEQMWLNYENQNLNDIPYLIENDDDIYNTEEVEN